MIRVITAIATAVILAACETVTTPPVPSVTPSNAADALNVYYNSIPSSELPSGPNYIEIDEAKSLTRIIVASCNDEEKENVAFSSIANEDADLFLFIGDNVYGDMDAKGFVNWDVELEEVVESYNDLAQQTGFVDITEKMPVLATWDDHDYGMNDFGRNFAGKVLAERIFENFFDLNDTDVAERPGVYYSKMIGPEGQRTQIIMLDTRFFRSDLTPTDERGKKGKERYIPSDASDQDMLGDAQWAWLEAELQKPADLRLLVSSIQIIPDVHGWEAWDKLPAERDRLYTLLNTTEANGVVFVSGDRHTAYLYKDMDHGKYPFYELTASSLNAAFSKMPDSDEVDERQIGLGYAWENYGAIDIDWAAKTLGLSILDKTGTPTSRKLEISFDEIKAG